MRNFHKGARSLARELALQGIYAWLISGNIYKNVNDINNDIYDNIKSNLVDNDWFKILINGVLDNHDSLCERFTPYIDRSLDSISPVEYAILLIGTFELINHFEIPYKVIINEAVELAKSFGGTDGFKFINSVLDKLASDVRNN
ncbi:N-utilization substance protein B [Candidatus Kinetoplastibacterium blastocrithidii TCC012E]|uniref:Transcription antitermination protein NusB n=1 Tax=Candidatus Kinetoplastidibacterium blastocrithidiae TCC012E TaxID=1208922 RepID=M1M077_9PROT|nr:transcription antitermination factor NusB [Candidatus Kinetoplastibacterium blastocrithidii]AFZ83588.1 N utilization substance protein B [Candidatus Kinetoplastibacterium blastocrithidii (ex Strigomonas culicis)]AGF49706.1 N-utilization substance protein B [Candidatus Kinetoplastibacterium blastocrithidii TCC012E]